MMSIQRGMKKRKKITFDDDDDDSSGLLEKGNKKQYSKKSKKDDDDDLLKIKNDEANRDFKLGRCSSENKKKKKLKHPPKLKKGDIVNISDLLFTKDRDYLITYNDRNRPVQAKHLKGKVVVLYFVALVPWTDQLRLYITNLVDIYNALHPKGGFEVVMVGVKIGKFPSNPQTLLNTSLEECFEQTFSSMPWTAIPFSDIIYQDSLERRLRHRFSRYVCDMFTNSVVIDPTGRVLLCQADDFFLAYGARAYPFSLQRINSLISKDNKALNRTSVTKLLSSLGRDYVINNKNQEVPVRDLEDKAVALYFYEDFPVDDLTKRIQAVYERLADKGNFEIVLVYVYDSVDSCGFASEESFWKRFSKMPWLALPFRDPRCKYMKRLFKYPIDLEGLGPDPRLVIIGPQGNFVEPYGFDILKNFGFRAYPFSRKRAAELEVKFLKKLKLDMFWDPNTSFKQGYGPKVKFSQLAGKRIILIIENGWATEFPKFWQSLIKRYLRMKETDNEFEVIHIPTKEMGSEYDMYVATLPWLRRPPISQRSKKYNMIRRIFRRGGVGLLAFDCDGRVVRRTIYPSIKRGNMHFPFYDGGLEKEALKDLIEYFDWSSSDRFFF